MRIVHGYSSDAWDRDAIPIWLAVLAIGLAWIIDWLANSTGWRVPWWVDAPSVMGIYALFRTGYNARVWHGRIGPVKLSAIPDIRGTWAGTGLSSHDAANAFPVVAYIDQTWSRLSVRLETEASRSASRIAALNTSSSPEPGLAYEYLNEPKPLSAQTMVPHRGVVHLRLSPDGSGLHGDYYTGRARQNVGTLSLQRVSKEILGQESALSLLSASTSDTLMPRPGGA